MSNKNVKTILESKIYISNFIYFGIILITNYIKTKTKANLPFLI